MSSVSERLQINPMALDKWSKKEQLCLASAVSLSGDQNWISVSRSLKLLCGSNRPPDWFSQKCCIVQYEELMKNAEAKRKRRINIDNDSGYSNNDEISPTNVITETTDLICRRLTEDRIQELKNELRQDQEEYAKIQVELKRFQAGNLSDLQIVEMWNEIEKENDMRRIEEMKLENQLRERAELKQELQRTWRQVGIYLQKPQLANVKKEESEMDDSVKLPQQQQHGMSPLLSSLLKSPTAISSSCASSTVRSIAPTITTLLTGGAIDPNKPVLTLKTTLPQSQVNALTRPISGPAATNSNELILSQQVQHNLRSPSQSAPTLSMLLEKNKGTPQQSICATRIASSSSPKLASVEEKFEDREVMDSNNEEVPMDIEEDLEEAVYGADDGNQSPTKEEEQQLMEVFKSIGNIDEFAGILNPAILEEESFLKDVESLMEDHEVADLEEKLKKTEGENERILISNQESKNLQPSNQSTNTANIKIEAKQTSLEKIQDKNNTKEETIYSSIKKHQTTKDLVVQQEKSDPAAEETSIEHVSSDDSNDNVPLVALSTYEAKANRESLSPVIKVLEIENEFTTTTESDYASKNSPLNYAIDLEEKSHTTEDPTVYNDDAQKDDDEDLSEITNAKDATASHKSSISENSDVIIIIPTDDESNEGKPEPTSKAIQSTENIQKPDKDKGLQTKQKYPTLNIRKSPVPGRNTPVTLTTTVSLPDTDEDSSTLDGGCSIGSISIKKDESYATQELSKHSTQTKKHESENNKVGEEAVISQPVSTPASSSSSSTIKQTLAIRKLRDRDRSESPMVEDDASDHSITVRSRRLYSSTPVIDSIPNSPASSDDRDFKAWRKSLMNFFNTILVNRNATIFLRPFTEEQVPKYKKVCLRPMDLQIIKKNIESGTIRNVGEFQRDVLLMCQNAIMVFKSNTTYFKMARDLMQDLNQMKDLILTESKADKEKEKSSALSLSSSYASGVKVRGSSRKSQRLP